MIYSLLKGLIISSFFFPFLSHFFIVHIIEVEFQEFFFHCRFDLIIASCLIFYHRFVRLAFILLCIIRLLNDCECGIRFEPLPLQVISLISLFIARVICCILTLLTHFSLFELKSKMLSVRILELINFLHSCRQLEI